MLHEVNLLLLLLVLQLVSFKLLGKCLKPDSYCFHYHRDDDLVVMTMTMVMMMIYGYTMALI